AASELVLPRAWDEAGAAASAASARLVMTERVVRIHRHGGPEELRLEDVPTPVPGPGEALVRHAAIGVNFIDVNHRLGRYPLDGFPRTLGMEGAGRVEAVGPGVAGVAPGDRVAYASHPIG